MLAIIACIGLEHDPKFTIAAIVVLISGALVTMRLFARARRTTSIIKDMWIILAGLIGGGTIWSTHFIAMLAYESPIALAYDPALTGLSLLVAMFMTTAGLYLAAVTQKSVLIEIGGTVFGLGIAIMHYTGVAAIRTEGLVHWDWNYVSASIAAGAIFGLVATNRIARPVTYFCKYGGALSFVLAVASLHFVGMTGISIEPFAGAETGGDLLSNKLLGFAIMSVMLMLMVAAMAAYVIDLKSFQQKRTELQHITQHDPLTGLPNRTRLEAKIHDRISTDFDDTASMVIASISLTNLNAVNEAYGQLSSDSMLKLISQRLLKLSDENVSFAYIAENEFVAIKAPIFAAKDAAYFCEHIQQVISEPVNSSAVTVGLSSVIGFTLYPKESASPSELIDQAVTAKRHARSIGRDHISAFKGNMGSESKERSELGIDLQNAIANDELQLHYQLQVNTATGLIEGVESLLRWQHPTKGFIPPDKFIAIAEETDQISEIGDWVLDRACRDAVLWPAPYRVAVNVAGPQISDLEFPKKVLSKLLEVGLDPGRLEIEITETGIISDMAMATHIIRQLKALGVCVAMDDFGTGYSSLSTLKSLPFDKIKVDREFVKEIETDHYSEAILKSTILLGNSLNIPVLAEGVETLEQANMLTDLGCKSLQGFLFGRPVTNDQLTEIAHGPQCLMECSSAVEETERQPLKQAS